MGEMRSRSRFTSLVAIFGVGVAGLWVGGSILEKQPQPAQAQEAMTIQKGAKVKMDYTLTVGGEVIDTSQGREPLAFVHGSGEIIPGLDNKLTGLKAGDEREIIVAPEDGYGIVDPAAQIQVPKSQLPPDPSPTVGMVLGGTDPDGQPFRAVVKEIGEENVTMDLNHPLAGKELSFKIKIVEVTAPEQS